MTAPRRVASRSHSAGDPWTADFRRRLRRAAGEARRRSARVDVLGARLVADLLAPDATAEQHARLTALERATRSTRPQTDTQEPS